MLRTYHTALLYPRTCRLPQLSPTAVTLLDCSSKEHATYALLFHDYALCAVAARCLGLGFPTPQCAPCPAQMIG